MVRFKKWIFLSCILTACLVILFFVLSSRHLAAHADDDDSTFIAVPLKYPVVLVHGIVAFDREGFISFWGRIPEKLEERGVRVFFGNTDAWGSVESNAEILKISIDAILEETDSEKVNIIAHSKGGVDSRYLIWKYDYGDKVASLTTISTPHHGAEIADVLYGKEIVHTKIAKRAFSIFGELYGDKNPDLLTVGHDLTTAKMKEFNETVGMDPRVYYQSLYTTMRNRMDDMMFFYSYQFIKSLGGNNDGIVSERSAHWGENVRKIDGRISHAEILDIKRRPISGIDIPGIYIAIVNELGAKGF
jgi:triacylglycerol lipase